MNDVADGSVDVVDGSVDVGNRSVDAVSRSDDLVNGSDDVVSGSDDVVSGSGDVVTRSEDVVNGSHDVVSGSDDVVSGSDDAVDGAVGTAIRSDGTVSHYCQNLCSMHNQRKAFCEVHRTHTKTSKLRSKTTTKPKTPSDIDKTWRNVGCTSLQVYMCIVVRIGLYSNALVYVVSTGLCSHDIYIYIYIYIYICVCVYCGVC